MNTINSTPIKEHARKRAQLRYLDETCEGVMKERGTLKTLFMVYDYWITHQMKRCDEAGCSREEVKAILNKYE